MGRICKSAGAALLGGGFLLLWGAGELRAEDDWQAKFEQLSAHSGEVMDLTPAQLQEMLAECEALRPRIEALPESPRKVYRKRLELACNLARFALEQKNQPPSSPKE